MDTEESLIFSELLFAYKRLWQKHQEFKYLTEHLGDNPESVHELFVDPAYDLFQPLADALVEGQPLQGLLRKLVREVEHPHED